MPKTSSINQFKNQFVRRPKTYKFTTLILFRKYALTKNGSNDLHLLVESPINLELGSFRFSTLQYHDFGFQARPSLSFKVSLQIGSDDL